MNELVRLQMLRGGCEVERLYGVSVWRKSRLEKPGVVDQGGACAIYGGVV